MLRVLLWAYIFILEPWGNMAIRLGKESGNFLEKVALKLRDDEYIIIDRKIDRSCVQVRESSVCVVGEKTRA